MHKIKTNKINKHKTNLIYFNSNHIYKFKILKVNKMETAIIFRLNNLNHFKIYNFKEEARNSKLLN